MTCTSPTLRHMSRIYLDLKSIHCQTISGLNPNQFDRPVHTMVPNTIVSQRPINCLLYCIHEQLEAHGCTWLHTTHPSLPWMLSISPLIQLPLPGRRSTMRDFMLTTCIGIRPAW